MDCTIVAPTKEHLFTLILLHEQESNGQTLYESLNQLTQTLPAIQECLTHAKLVLPHGPVSLSSIVKTIPRSWITVDSRIDPDLRMWHQVGPIAKAMGRIVDEEAGLVGRRNVFVGGHGMGCAVGLALLLYLDAPVGGFFGAAPFMLFADTVDRPANPAKRQKTGDHVFKVPEVPRRAAKDADLSKVLDPRLWVLYVQARDTNNNTQPTGQQPTTPSPLPPANNARLYDIVSRLRSYSGDSGKKDIPPYNNAVATPIALAHNTHNPHVSVGDARKALETMQRLGFRASLDLLDIGQHEVTTHMLEKFITEFLKSRT